MVERKTESRSVDQVTVLAFAGDFVDYSDQREECRKNRSENEVNPESWTQLKGSNEKRI